MSAPGPLRPSPSDPGGPASGAPPPAPGDGPEACDPHGGCITCSDEGTPMRVVGDAGDGLAVCEDERGSRREVMTGVVGRLEPGEWVLVHAGAALLRLPDRRAPSAAESADRIDPGGTA